MATFLQPADAIALWNAPREQAISDAQAALAEKKLYYFFRYSWPIIEPGNPFVDSWHLGCLAEHLEAVFANEINRLAICLPRRRSKSSLCSVAWFCWAWIKQPWTRWSFMSYGQDLSLRDSVKCRDVITSPWYQRHWPIKLKDDRNAQLCFANDQQGYRLATSTGGKVVGFGADVNCWDDGHDYRDAWSPTQLEKDVKVWVNGVHRSVNDPKKARFLVVGQRLAENDLPGYLMRNDLGYEFLVLPEEYEVTRVFFTKEDAAKSKERDPIVMTKIQRERPVVRIGKQIINVRDPRKEDGELLSAERYPREVVELEKRASAYEFASQNQQRPHPLEGSIIKDTMFRDFRMESREGRPTFVLQVAPDRVRYYPVSECRFFQTIDTALKDTQESDRTACCTWALTPGADLLLYDCWAYRIAVPYQLAALDRLRVGRCLWVAESSSFIDLEPWPRPLLFQAVEEAASGIGLIQAGMARGTPFKVLKADQNPMAKIAPLAAAYGAGKVYHLEGAAWRAEYEEEALGFPHAAHDDRFISASYAGFLLRHEAILTLHLDRDLTLSDYERAMRPENFRRNRYDDDKLRIQTPGGEIVLEYER